MNADERLNRAYAFVDEFFLEIQEIRREWEHATRKFPGRCSNPPEHIGSILERVMDEIKAKCEIENKEFEDDQGHNEVRRLEYRGCHSIRQQRD
jgi:hypothetical protein